MTMLVQKLQINFITLLSNLLYIFCFPFIVTRIRRDPEPRNEELRRAVAKARKGLCFLKIT